VGFRYTLVKQILGGLWAIVADLITTTVWQMVGEDVGGWWWMMVVDFGGGVARSGWSCCPYPFYSYA